MLFNDLHKLTRKLVHKNINKLSNELSINRSINYDIKEYVNNHQDIIQNLDNHNYLIDINRIDDIFERTNGIDDSEYEPLKLINMREAKGNVVREKNIK